MSSSEFIRVNARLRPSASGVEKPVFLVDAERNIIKCTNKNFAFDKTFGADSTQEMIFKEVGKRVIDGAIEGINGTIFAYDFEKTGLIPRCIEYLFSQLELVQIEKGSKFCFSVSCSFVELYNENLSDLLTANCPPIAIRAESRKIILQGAVCETITSYIDAMRLIQIGWENRTVGETKMNKVSSRSHAVLIIDLTMTDDDGGVINKREARINLVDLAGSERQSQTKSTGIRLKEAGKINQSLCTLGRVIRDLSAKKSHIPYRDSKLTLMIRDSLGGNSRTAVIVCAHPDEDFFAESLSTLQFAEQCRLVKNELYINREVTGESVTALRSRIQQLEDLLNNSNKELTSKFEEKLRLVEEERDNYKQLLITMQREKERADLEETMAACESPPQQYKTPATKKRICSRDNKADEMRCLCCSQTVRYLPKHDFCSLEEQNRTIDDLRENEEVRVFQMRLKRGNNGRFVKGAFDGTNGSKIRILVKEGGSQLIRRNVELKDCCKNKCVYVRRH